MQLHLHSVFSCTESRCGEKRYIGNGHAWRSVKDIIQRGVILLMTVVLGARAERDVLVP